MNDIYIIEFTSPSSPASRFHSEYFISPELAETFLDEKDYKKEFGYNQKFESKKDNRQKAYIFNFSMSQNSFLAQEEIKDEIKLLKETINNMTKLNNL